MPNDVIYGILEDKSGNLWLSTKPFSSRELLARVKNLVAQRRKLRESFSRFQYAQLFRQVLSQIVWLLAVGV